MKKIAFYVEGQTEQFFINKLLVEIAGRKNIAIELKKFSGKNVPPSSGIFPKTQAAPVNHNHHALIYDCGGDEGVKPRILEDCQGLFSNGYYQILGLRDLFPLVDLQALEDKLQNGIVKNGKTLIEPMPANTEVIVAVNEVEAWFLGECAHYLCIDPALTHNHIITNIGFDPCQGNLENRNNPALDLHNIYQSVGKAYMSSSGTKPKNRIQRTVECLDYRNLQNNVAQRMPKLQYLIDKIEDFLT